MDMRKYAGSRFIKFDDVGRLSINATNCNTLIRAFGDDDRDWIGCEIELYAGQIDYQGAKKDSVLVRPLSLQKNPAPAQPKRDDLDDQIPF